MVPSIGDRYAGGCEDFRTVLEYVGINPKKTRGDDEHLLKVITAPPKSYKPGDLVAVEEKWFETHRPVPKTRRTHAQRR